MSALAPTLQAFFIDRLARQRGASPNTVAAYRDTFRLLLRFASERTGKQPCDLDIGDIDASCVGDFLQHLEAVRLNSVRTRNNRLAAVHSLFRYAALEHPEHAASIQRVLAIPPKSFARNLVVYLDDEEVSVLIAACDLGSWTGRRDHAMLVLAIQAGPRISELADLVRGDVTLGRGANVHVVGKGRKERCTPLVPETVAVLRSWLDERGGDPDDPLFPTTTGRHMSRDAIERRISLHVGRAATKCPSLLAKPVTIHTLRHTCAMRLLAAGVEITIIALWLGHEQVSTTYGFYLHADMKLKERAVDRVAPLGTKPGRYRAPDSLLAFLESL